MTGGRDPGGEAVSNTAAPVPVKDQGATPRADEEQKNPPAPPAATGAAAPTHYVLPAALMDDYLKLQHEKDQKVRGDGSSGI